EGGSMFGNHPIVWCHELPRKDTGNATVTPIATGAPIASGNPARAIYTGGGHTKESYSEPAFLQHLTGAIAWATRREVQVEAPAAEQNSEASSAVAPAPTSAPVPSE
ncbi:MAG: ThuA domain-containing protein, partial [Planctomycetota bacterium]|nr:ThuA domain-containing protein [Planctomycetota bacterium]